MWWEFTFIQSIFFHFIYNLWSISSPGKTGTPNLDLSGDPEVRVAGYSNSHFTSAQAALERVITKVFSHYGIPLDITEAIRSTFKSKLWRMGQLYAKQGSKQRQEQLNKWKDGVNSVWNFQVSEVKVAEGQLTEECAKRRKIESEAKLLEKTTKKQAKLIAKLKSGSKENSRGSSSKSWDRYSRQKTTQ